MSSVKEIEKCFSSCHERGKKIKDNRNKIERKKTSDSYQKRDRDLGRGGVYCEKIGYDDGSTTGNKGSR